MILSHARAENPIQTGWTNNEELLAHGLETSPEGEAKGQAWNDQGFHSCSLLFSWFCSPSYDGFTLHLNNKMVAVPGLPATHNRRKTILSNGISSSRNSLKISPHVLWACTRLHAFSWPSSGGRILPWDYWRRPRVLGQCCIRLLSPTNKAGMKPVSPKAWDCVEME